MVHHDVWRSSDAMDDAMDAVKSTAFCIGLTGGIGSGKTTVANFFAKLGVPIIDADDIAHQITKPHALAYRTIVTHFGKQILNDDNTIDRRKLRHLIFENPAEKKWLENELHPLIRQTMRQKIQQIEFPYCICVIPLLTESNDIEFIDRVLVVDSPMTIQIERAKKRDNATAEDIQKIINSQSSRFTRLKMADDVIVNDGDIIALENKVFSLHQAYLTSLLS